MGVSLRTLLWGGRNTSDRVFDKVVLTGDEGTLHGKNGS